MSVAFITLTNAGYVEYTKNCLTSLRALGAPEPVCYCIGSESFHIMQEFGAKCVHIDDEAHAGFETFRKGAWHAVTAWKFKAIHDNLQRHDFVCITDGDIVFRDARFLEYCRRVMRSDLDLIIQNDAMDDNSSAQLCSGFMFIRSSPRTLAAFDPVSFEPYAQPGLDDQVYVNAVLKSTLRFLKLPLALFPNGKYFYTHAPHLKPLMVHFNWVVGHEKKDRMVQYGMWMLPPQDA